MGNNVFTIRQRATTTLLICWILHIVEEKPRHGRPIILELHRRFRGHWRPAKSTIYPLFLQLEKEGYLRGVWNDPHKRRYKTYYITDAGKKRLERGRKMLLPLLKDTEAIIQIAYKDLLAR